MIPRHHPEGHHSRLSQGKDITQFYSHDTLNIPKLRQFLLDKNVRIPIELMNVICQKFEAVVSNCGIN